MPELGSRVKHPEPSRRQVEVIRPLVLLLVMTLAGCASPQSATPTTGPGSGAPAVSGRVSCQPFGYEPVLITFAYPAGPATAEVGGQTAVGMLRACASTPDESGVSATITKLTSSVSAGTGGPQSPNAGQSVWVVEIDTLESIRGGDAYPAHYWIEVNQATGVPTLIAYG